MPVIQWDGLPGNVRQHLIDDLNQLRRWMETNPEVPDGGWFKDFGSFKLCGRGPLPTTFLLRGQAAKGEKL